MSSLNTKIEWTDRTWSPVRGCALVSAGCANCYAMKQAHRFSGVGKPYEGLTELGPHGPRWTGKITLVPEALDEPLRWKKPCRIFVNSMSDLFHEDVPDLFIVKMFAIMALAPRHTFQILTKRPERMSLFLGNTNIRSFVMGEAWSMLGRLPKYEHGDIQSRPWPLPNVQLGVSVENQQTADERNPLLLQTRAAVRFISVEPLLGPIQFPLPCKKSVFWTGLHWVIVGGESGPGARPMHPEWARAIRDQCVAAGVPFFFKQWGEWAPIINPVRSVGCGVMVRAGDVVVTKDGRTAPIDDQLNCVLEGEGTPMRKVGKKKAGALVDGREWKEFPR